MGQRQREWGKRVRAGLFEALGRRCVLCGATEDLELDCILPMGHEHHRIEWSWRQSFYRQMHRAENLQVLCRECNGRKGFREGQ